MSGGWISTSYPPLSPTRYTADIGVDFTRAYDIVVEDVYDDATTATVAAAATAAISSSPKKLAFVIRRKKCNTNDTTTTTTTTTTTNNNNGVQIIQDGDRLIAINGETVRVPDTDMLPSSLCSVSNSIISTIFDSVYTHATTKLTLERHFVPAKTIEEYVQQLQTHNRILQIENDTLLKRNQQEKGG